MKPDPGTQLPIATADALVASPPASTAAAPDHALPPPPSARGRRRVLLALAITAAVVAAMIPIGLVVRDDIRNEDVLLSEDFESGEPEFSTDSDRLVDLSVVDGVYRVTFRDARSPQLVRHIFTRSHDGLSLRATVVHPADATDDVLSAAGCWAGDSGYLFALSSDGEAGIIEVVSESTGERVDLAGPIAADAARPPGEPNRLRIDCVGGGKDPTVISGYVNGDPIVSVAVPVGYDSFNAVGFFLVSAKDGSVITIDDVIASAERPAPGMSPIPPIQSPSAEPAGFSSGCGEVFADARTAADAGYGTDVLDIIGLGAPKECATLAEAEAAAVEHFGRNGAKGLERYLARSCASVGPSAGIHGTELCEELLAMHPELT